mmetsp:Transcript_29098/g.35449  ORF Transcript_29098/g.35449 Transcript_29098/m.35449 type:complete len:227 (-) Transcript_29098:220-900(-)
MDFALLLIDEAMQKHFGSQILLITKTLPPKLHFRRFCSRLSSRCTSISCKSPSSGTLSPGPSGSTVIPAPTSSFGSNLTHAFSHFPGVTTIYATSSPSKTISPTSSNPTPILSSTFGIGSEFRKSAFDTRNTATNSADAASASSPSSGFVNTKRQREDPGYPPARSAAQSARFPSRSSTREAAGASRNGVATVSHASDAATARFSISSRSKFFARRGVLGIRFAGK